MWAVILSNYKRQAERMGPPVDSMGRSPDALNVPFGAGVDGSTHGTQRLKIMAKKIVGGAENEIAQIRVEYVSALKTVGTARAAIADCVKRLAGLVPDRKALRDMLISWACQAGAKKLTAASEVSRQMVAAGLSLRAKGGGRKPKTPKTAPAEPAAKTAPAESAPKAPELTSGGGPEFILKSIRAMYPGISKAELAGVLKQAYLLAVADAL